MKRVLILGAAACLWDDLKALGHWDGAVMAVNRAGASYPGKIDHWVTLHPEFLADWVEIRSVQFGPSEFATWSHKEHDGALVDRIVRDIEPRGSSGLFAVNIALRYIGARRVVLAGIPIDDGPHFYDADGQRSGPPFGCYRPEWKQAEHHEFAGRVRSMSGWTAELLGKPDAEWLKC